jgi:hypothetical protein
LGGAASRFEQGGWFNRVRRSFAVGTRVEVTDDGDAEEWLAGTVTDTDSFDGRPRVQRDGFDPPG